MLDFDLFALWNFGGDGFPSGHFFDGKYNIRVRWRSCGAVVVIQKAWAFPRGAVRDNRGFCDGIDCQGLLLKALEWGAIKFANCNG